MPADPAEEFTALLLDPQLSDAARAERLLPLVYEQLRAVAQQRLAAERAGHTLQATALVHEAYLRLVGERQLAWQNRAHFFAAAAEAMRRVLLDHAKARGRVRRGAGSRPISLELAGVADLATEDSETIVAVDEAFRRLGGEDPRAAEVVRLRFYAGLSVDETAQVLGVSPRSVAREWTFARSWLARELREFQRGTGDESAGAQGDPG